MNLLDPPDYFSLFAIFVDYLEIYTIYLNFQLYLPFKRPRIMWEPFELYMETIFIHFANIVYFGCKGH